MVCEPNAVHTLKSSQWSAACSLKKTTLEENYALKWRAKTRNALEPWNSLNGRNQMARATNLEATSTSAGAETLHSQDIKNGEKCLKVTEFIVILNQQRKMLDSACERRPQTVSI